MAYGYWKSGKHDSSSSFDLFFRRNPFGGEFTVFCGLGDCLSFIEKFKFTKDDIDYLKTVLSATTENAFFDYLASITTNDIKVYAIREGSVVFPRVPLIRIDGPLAIVQLLETTLLTLVNFSSLVATNAARFRLAAGDKKQLFEFGLRRAQGPNGAMCATKYCYVGGFDGTSNVLAGKLYGIPVRGTHAHSFVTSYSHLDEAPPVTNSGQHTKTFTDLCIEKLQLVSGLLNVLPTETNTGELAAFIAYASAFPSGFLSLVDTYDIGKSGVPNFCAVALSLYEWGQYRPLGIRLDSGDLAYHSKECRRAFRIIAESCGVPWFASLTIVASNDINEETLHSLNQQGHEIDSYGIGTHLVTCQRQPALGCVFKLVELCNEPRIKLSEEPTKLTLPGRKQCYRLYGQDPVNEITPSRNHTENALVDLMQRWDEPPPSVGQRVLCRHPFHESRRAYVTPSLVQPLYELYWADAKRQQPHQSLTELRDFTARSLAQLRSDHKRALNPTPYKVSVSDDLYSFMHELWLKNAPIGELA